MPLSKGTSKKALSENIRSEMHSFKEKGKIGNITPKNPKHAQQISIAIAFSQQKKNKKNK